MSKKIKRNPRSLGRKWALQYLYQSDIAKLEFQEEEFALFIDQIENAVRIYVHAIQAMQTDL